MLVFKENEAALFEELPLIVFWVPAIVVLKLFDIFRNSLYASFFSFPSSISSSILKVYRFP